MDVTACSQQRRKTTRLERRALASLLAEGRRLAEGETIDAALAAIASSAAATTGADVVVARVLDPAGHALVARACASVSAALATEIEGTRIPIEEVRETAVDELDQLPPTAARIAERAGATAVLQLPIRLAGRTVGSLDVFRRGEPFGEEDRVLARLAASQAALSIAALEPTPALADGDGVLALIGDAFAASIADGAAGEAVARLALEASGATACRVWQADRGEVSVSSAPEEAEGVLTQADAFEALAAREAVRVLDQPGGGAIVILQLGRPPSGLLELRFAEERRPEAGQLGALAVFASRAGEALRAGEQTRRLADELERTRALLAVVGQAIARLSLSHTLETAAEQVARLLHVERVAIYLDEGDGLAVAAERQLAGPHAEVAARLLELALGRYRARGSVSL